MRIIPQLVLAGALLTAPHAAVAYIRHGVSDDFRLLDENKRKPRPRNDFASTGGKFTFGDKTFETYEEWIASDEFKANGAACSTRSPSHEEERLSNYVTEKWKEQNPCEKANEKNPTCRGRVLSDGRTLSETTTEVIRIETHFHVIQDGNGDGRDQTAVDASIQRLNDAYAPDFVFDLVNTTFIPDDEYYGSDFSTDATMKQKLRRGNCDTLNVYANEPAGGMLGYSTFPNTCKTDILDDGVVILDESMPGGTATNYNLGNTLVHEVGHWLGLYHTFQDGCDGGDLIGDTPAEATPSFSCDARDTCPNHAGMDPVNNYMDYSPDVCMNEFTAQQRVRMRAQWDEFRFNITHDPPNYDPVCEEDEVMVEITIKADNFEQETSWYVTDMCSSTDKHHRVVLGSSNPNGGIDDVITKACVSEYQKYVFTIEDSYGDGMCCAYGDGMYSIKYNGTFVVQDKKGVFKDSDEVEFGPSTCAATTTPALNTTTPGLNTTTPGLTTITPAPVSPSSPTAKPSQYSPVSTTAGSYNVGPASPAAEPSQYSPGTTSAGSNDVGPASLTAEPSDSPIDESSADSYTY